MLKAFRRLFCLFNVLSNGVKWIPRELAATSHSQSCSIHVRQWDAAALASCQLLATPCVAFGLMKRLKPAGCLPWLLLFLQDPQTLDEAVKQDPEVPNGQDPLGHQHASDGSWRRRIAGISAHITNGLGFHLPGLHQQVLCVTQLLRLSRSSAPNASNF